MKTRATSRKTGRNSELKGVVKKMAGTLTNDPALENEGRAEMLGDQPGPNQPRGGTPKRNGVNPDPHRRG